jgi:hypothetical protein
MPFCLISTLIGCSKKEKKAKHALDDAVLVAGTLQNMNNLYF